MLLCFILCCAVTRVVGTRRIVAVTVDGDTFKVIEGNADNALAVAAFGAAYSHTGGFRVGDGVHDSYTFQCGLVGSFTSPGIDTRLTIRHSHRPINLYYTIW